MSKEIIKKIEELQKYIAICISEFRKVDMFKLLRYTENIKQLLQAEEPESAWEMFRRLFENDISKETGNNCYKFLGKLVKHIGYEEKVNIYSSHNEFMVVYDFLMQFSEQKAIKIMREQKRGRRNDKKTNM